MVESTQSASNITSENLLHNEDDSEYFYNKEFVAKCSNFDYV